MAKNILEGQNVMKHVFIDPQTIPEFIEWAHEILDPDDVDLPEECDCHYKNRLKRIREAFIRFFCDTKEVVDSETETIDEKEKKLMAFLLRVLPITPETLVDIDVEAMKSNKQHLVVMIVNEE